MEEDITKTPLVDIMKEMTKLDNQIDLLLLKREKLCLEVIRRFPQLEKDPTFETKNKKL